MPVFSARELSARLAPSPRRTFPVKFVGNFTASLKAPVKFDSNFTGMSRTKLHHRKYRYTVVPRQTVTLKRYLSPTIARINPGQEISETFWGVLVKTIVSDNYELAIVANNSDWNLNPDRTTFKTLIASNTKTSLWRLQATIEYREPATKEYREPVRKPSAPLPGNGTSAAPYLYQDSRHSRSCKIVPRCNAR